MDPERINVSFPEGFNQQTFELVITQGEHPPLNNPIRFLKAVALSSIAAMVLAGKYEKDPAKNKGVVIYNLQPGKLGIQFNDNVNDALSNLLEAKLSVNPELEAWGINKDKRFGIKQLIKHVRAQTGNFADPSKVAQIIKSLQNFDVKFTAHHSKEDDRKGNKEEKFKTSLEFTKGAIADYIWNLSMPLFKSTSKVNFPVEIEIDEENGDPVISFYSLELEVMLQDLGSNIVTNEVDKFRDFFVCMEVND